MQTPQVFLAPESCPSPHPLPLIHAVGPHGVPQPVGKLVLPFSETTWHKSGALDKYKCFGFSSVKWRQTTQRVGCKDSESHV